MKKILLIALALLAGTSQADDDKSDTFCTAINSLAKSIMTARQQGVSLAQAIEVAEGSAIKAIVLDAYERPRYRTEDNQQRQVVEFQDEWYMACLRQYPSA